jgi:hypothetical protein
MLEATGGHEYEINKLDIYLSGHYTTIYVVIYYVYATACRRYPSLRLLFLFRHCRRPLHLRRIKFQARSHHQLRT